VDVVSIRGTINSADIFADLELRTGSLALSIVKTFSPGLSGATARGGAELPRAGDARAATHVRAVQPHREQLQLGETDLRGLLESGTRAVVTRHFLFEQFQSGWRADVDSLHLVLPIFARGRIPAAGHLPRGWLARGHRRGARRGPADKGAAHDFDAGLVEGFPDEPLELLADVLDAVLTRVDVGAVLVGNVELIEELVPFLSRRERHDACAAESELLDMWSELQTEAQGQLKLGFCETLVPKSRKTRTQQSRDAFPGAPGTPLRKPRADRRTVWPRDSPS
jgi:hypothetical protein